MTDDLKTYWNLIPYEQKLGTIFIAAIGIAFMIGLIWGYDMKMNEDIKMLNYAANTNNRIDAGLQHYFVFTNETLKNISFVNITIPNTIRSSDKP